MDHSGNQQLSLPENAYRRLNEGEEYLPVVPNENPLPELTPYSLILGLLFAVLFTAASSAAVSTASTAAAVPLPGVAGRKKLGRRLAM